MWWLFFQLLIALVKGYKSMYLCHFVIDSYIVTVCTGYLVLRIPMYTVAYKYRCLCRFLHKPNDRGWIPNKCVTDTDCSHCSVVTLSVTREQWLHSHSGSHCVVTVPSVTDGRGVLLWYFTGWTRHTHVHANNDCEISLTSLPTLNHTSSPKDFY